MSYVDVEIVAPFWLKLQGGAYDVGEQGQRLSVAPGPLLEGTRAATLFQQRFEVAAAGTVDEAEALKLRLARALLQNANLLLRWYRVFTRRIEIAELSLSLASPFRFRPDATLVDPLWRQDLAFESQSPAAVHRSIDEITDHVRRHLQAGDSPRVADLFLLDAESSYVSGRYREVVLFCWSTIDATFNQKYDQLVAGRLHDEYAAAREFFSGVDFGIKNKMTAAMYLLAGRSLYREEGLWPDLAASYTRRNEIIHRGALANEDDARRALRVARQVVEIMDSL